ncbi:MAG TPA: hypothetical protein PKM43_13965 [Verrucomicrobiota bacterium]|nr:hypothetical protein [Verrucomicrobiota bacterium]HRZ36963.1 hypothetical protein [Candidatus Paceibacterota bacterium]HRZ57488.1 hypothetical protein [Candidatus Paceibacterota bacterium]
MESLNAALQELNGDILRKLLRTLELPASGLTRKEQFVQALEHHAVAHLPEIVARLSPAERLYLAEAVHQGRLLGSVEFAAKHNLAAPSWDLYCGYREETASLLRLFLYHPPRGAACFSRRVARSCNQRRSGLPGEGTTRVGSGGRFFRTGGVVLASFQRRTQ